MNGASSRELGRKRSDWWFLKATCPYMSITTCPYMTFTICPYMTFTIRPYVAIPSSALKDIWVIRIQEPTESSKQQISLLFSSLD